jgi:hypothetical protein
VENNSGSDSKPFENSEELGNILDDGKANLQSIGQQITEDSDTRGLSYPVYH